MREAAVTATPPAAPWYALSPEEILSAIDARPEGLSSEEAARRLERFGPNLIEAEEESPWWELALHQFRDPLIYILLAAAGVSLALRDVNDAGVILAVVLLNAIIGFVQEYRAQQAMRALARLSAPRAEVLRDGSVRSIPGAEVVPGDVVLLTSGALIPADLRLLSVRDLEVDESALTGESLPVRKDAERRLSGSPVPGDQVNMAFAGTIVTRGRARGVVVGTASSTEVGRIAKSVQQLGETATPLQEKVHSLGNRLGVALIGLSAVAVVVGLLRAMSAGEIFMTAVAMAVSAVPEGLPVVLTVTLAVGVSRMARRRAIVRKLPAVETLGSTTVIASDKTGTLTRNEMTVRAVWAAGRRYDVTGTGYVPEGEIRRDGAAASPARDRPLKMTVLAGVLANEADARSVESGEPLGDPTEVALLVAAAKAGMHPMEIAREMPELDLLPFEPERRFMASLNRDGESNAVFMKGAPEAVLARCSYQLGESGIELVDRQAVLEAARSMGDEGLRVLAMAYRPHEAPRIAEDELAEAFVLAGLQGMEDPVREEAVDAVAVVQRAGIRVLMVTGDHALTARAIGRQLGLGGKDARAIEGRELQTLGDEELDRLLAEGVEIFARVAPEHKLRIVQRLRERGEVVAVTGDGVNDAPALRAAHLGVAMGRSGTDVAREASDMVLVDDNFATIKAAVEEGRVVFANVRKVTFFLLSTAVGEVITIVLALLAGWPLPFVAAQILWINLVTNGLQDVALAVEPGEPGLLDRRPRPIGEGILSRRLLGRLGGVGAVLAAGTLFIFWWSLFRHEADLDRARTVAMTQMVVFQFFHVFNCRSLDRSVFSVPPFSNLFLFASLLAAFLAQLAVLYFAPLQTIFRTVPLSAAEWGVIVLVGSTVILGGELDKWWNRHEHTPLG